MNFIATGIGGGILGLISLLLYISGMGIAGYYSWTCNDAHGYGLISKLLFAIVASLGSWSYLIAYMLYKWGIC